MTTTSSLCAVLIHDNLRHQFCQKQTGFSDTAGLLRCCFMIPIFFSFVGCLIWYCCCLLMLNNTEKTHIVQNSKYVYAVFLLMTGEEKKIAFHTSALQFLIRFSWDSTYNLRERIAKFCLFYFIFFCSEKSFRFNNISVVCCRCWFGFKSLFLAWKLEIEKWNQFSSCSFWLI